MGVSMNNCTKAFMGGEEKNTAADTLSSSHFIELI